MKSIKKLKTISDTGVVLRSKGVGTTVKQLNSPNGHVSNINMEIIPAGKS